MASHERLETFKVLWLLTTWILRKIVIHKWKILKCGAAEVLQRIKEEMNMLGT
jgi:hypothetical protein